MPQYVVIAWDGTDPEAPTRRAAVRDAHLDNVAPMFADGRMKEGGAILNDQGHMIGSTCIVEFDDPSQLDEWLRTDPYIVGGVWQRIEVHPFRCAPRRAVADMHVTSPDAESRGRSEPEPLARAPGGGQVLRGESSVT